MKKVISITLAAIMLSVVLIGCTTPAENTGNGDAPTSEYAGFIGTWQGYAIAVTETVVITDIVGDYAEFHFVHTSSIDGSITESPTYTLPIVDSQIRLTGEGEDFLGDPFVINMVLSFHDDHINLFRYFDDADEGVEWRLERV